MEFKGPQPVDLKNVASLNRRFLGRLRASADGEPLRRLLLPAHQTQIAGLGDLQLERLSGTPFLLFSLREYDVGLWSHVFDEGRNRDLFTQASATARPGGRLLAAALGYMWQLARDNPYAARIICGASLDWCEQLAACTLISLLVRTDEQPELLEPRLAGDRDFWNRLLGPGLSSEQEIRKAAHVCALQKVLTCGNSSDYTRLRSAACTAPPPALRAAERPQRS